MVGENNITWSAKVLPAAAWSFGGPNPSRTYTVSNCKHNHGCSMPLTAVSAQVRQTKGQELFQASYHAQQCQLHTHQRLLMPCVCSCTCLSCRLPASSGERVRHFHQPRCTEKTRRHLLPGRSADAEAEVLGRPPHPASAPASCRCAAPALDESSVGGCYASELACKNVSCFLTLGSVRI